MTQIKIFTETTYSGSACSPGSPKVENLQQKVNDFLAENADAIIVKDIKFETKSPNPHQVYNLSTKVWTIMVIYETK